MEMKKEWGKRVGGGGGGRGGGKGHVEVKGTTHLAGFPTLLISPRLVSEGMELHAV